MRIHRTRVLKLLIIVNPKLFLAIFFGGIGFYIYICSRYKKGHILNVGILIVVKMKIKVLKFKNEKEMENVILTFVKCDIHFATIGRRELVLLTD